MQLPFVEALGDQDTSLHEAARSGDVRAVERLLGAGAEVDRKDANGHTPLLFAAMAGHVGVVRVLLKSGANRDIEDDLGYTAYKAAMLFGDFRGATRPPFDEVMALLKGRN